jgi:hypothetical protein
MKKIAVLICSIVSLAAFSTKSYAQFYYLNNDYYDTEVLFEVGASAGAMNCLTDMGGQKVLVEDSQRSKLRKYKI